MADFKEEIVRIKRSENEALDIAFSICTVANDLDEYATMVESFSRAGFTSADCEFLLADNSETNRFDCFSAYNIFLHCANGRYIILCHQDVELQFDQRSDLEARIAELDHLDPTWALCGNAGGTGSKNVAIRITDRYGVNQSVGRFPCEAQSLDENFILVKAEANLALPRDISGFHFYGLELCTAARLLGWSAYVVDFHLLHKGMGTFTDEFLRMRNEVQRRYDEFFRPRFVRTTVAKIRLGKPPLKEVVPDFAERMIGKLKNIARRVR